MGKLVKKLAFALAFNQVFVMTQLYPRDVMVPTGSLYNIFLYKSNKKISCISHGQRIVGYLTSNYLYQTNINNSVFHLGRIACYLTTTASTWVRTAEPVMYSFQTKPGRE